MTHYSEAPHIQKLESFFCQHLIARLDEMQRLLGVSGRTVFRILNRMGYLSSYSHGGRYYALAQLPLFDADGLWAHAGVLFSRHRTLRHTIVHLVNKAPAGHTHAELQHRLQLRVHDTLHDLVAARAIGRAEIERIYLYVNAQASEAEAQIAERQRLIAAPPLAGPLPDAAVIIEVLLTLIHAPRPDVVSIAALLASQGKAITREQVDAVWAHYELGKKKPALRRLRY